MDLIQAWNCEAEVFGKVFGELCLCLLQGCYIPTASLTLETNNLLYLQLPESVAPLATAELFFSFY